MCGIFGLVKNENSNISYSSEVKKSLIEIESINKQIELFNKKMNNQI